MAKKEKISIFDSARAKVSSVSKSSKDDKEVVYIDGLESKLLELEFLKAQVKDLTAQEKAINDEVKEISREKFVELYKANKENPNTFLIKDGEGCVMVIPTDSYKKIEDKDRANQLIEEYGEDVITIEEKYYFNPKVLERNMAAVEKLIMDAKTISDDDKRNLLLPDIKYSITKGYIDKLSQYGSKMQTVIDDIQPTIALKNCGGKMEEGGMMGDDFIGNVYDNEEDGELYYTQDYFEYVDWSGDGNNDGYLYGINLLDNNGDVIDAEWFESDQERRNYVLENNLFEYKFKRGGKVDGRSTRAKSTWNRGGAWTRDRNAHNKSEDWEKPMNKRKYAEGGGVERFDEISDYVEKIRENRKAKGLGEMTQEEHSNLINELQEKFNVKKFEENIKDWYIKNYPTDELGEEINDITFEDLWNSNSDNIYDVIGVGDSIIRERLFEHLSEIYGVSYDYVYDRLFGNEYKRGGKVPRNVGRDWIFKSKQKWEQDYDRKREYKEYKKEGWLANWFKDGGITKEAKNYSDEQTLLLDGFKALANSTGIEFNLNDFTLTNIYDKAKYYLTKDQPSTNYKVERIFELTGRSKNLHNAIQISVDSDYLWGSSKYSFGMSTAEVNDVRTVKSSQSFFLFPYYKNKYNEVKGGYSFKDGGNVGFGEVYNEVVNVIMTKQNISYDEAVDIINNEEMEAWLRNMVEYHGETDANFLAEQILTTDEGKYAKGGVPRNVGRDWLFKSKQDWEQKYDRKREWKEYKKEGWFANWFKDGGEAEATYKGNDVYPPFVDNFDYGSDLTDEAMVKNNLVDGEISSIILKQIVGCELSYPYQIVGAIKLEKCFMRPYYKLS